MSYCDLHCDALTTTSARQVTTENLRRGGCLLQCFAAFVSVREGRFESALSLADQFDVLCKAEGVRPVRNASQVEEGKLNALLTVEEGGAVEGSLEKLAVLYNRGVRMMSLTWNYENELAFPCFPDYEGLFTGKRTLIERERERGLKPFGLVCVEKMNELGMIVDVSHASDKTFFDVAEVCRKAKKPFVASHSGANAVYTCARNLTDEQLRTLADCDGVVGLDFCADFLSNDTSAEGQRNALLAHARAIVNAGGEEVLAIGSDFDGIPENAYIKNPADMPHFLELLQKEFGSAAAEKFARKNFLRVFREVCKQ